MAERSRDHPAFAWLLRLLDSRNPSDAEGYAGRWVVSDGERVVASGTDLGLVLREIAGQSPDRFAIAFLRIGPGPSGPGDWTFESTPLDPAGSGGGAAFEEYGALHAIEPR